MFVYQIEFLFNPFCYNSCFSCLPNGLPRIIGNIPTVSFMSFPVLRYHISYLFRCENFNFHCNQRQMNVEHISLTCKCFIINSRYRIIFECFLWANSIYSSPPPPISLKWERGGGWESTQPPIIKNQGRGHTRWTFHDSMKYWIG